MILRAIPLDFRRDFDRSGAVAIPKDPELHRLLVKFAEEHLVDQPNYADDYLRVWAAVEMDENDKLVSVQGVLGYVMRPDVTLCRFLNAKALSKLFNRTNDFFADNGVRGLQVSVYVNPQEDPKQKCPNVEETLKAIGAVPAHRWMVTVK